MNDDWQLENFGEWLELWEYNEPASAALDNLPRIVAAWIMNRASNPYQGAKRDSVDPTLWFATIPDTEHDGQMVVCTYWIVESTRTVRCSMIMTLGLPIE